MDLKSGIDKFGLNPEDINDLYDEDTDPLFERDIEGKLLHRPSKITMGIDFGGNGSMTTFVLKLYFHGYHDLRTAEEANLELSPDIDAEAICSKFIEFSNTARESTDLLTGYFQTAQAQR